MKPEYLILKRKAGKKMFYSVRKLPLRFIKPRRGRKRVQ